MKLQTSSRLAIFALIELAADPDRQVSVSEIGQKYNVSSHHLAKVMHTLGRAGLVRSIRGVGGGYSFSGNAKRTTLFDVIMLFEDADSSEYTPEGSQDASLAEWALGQVLFEINDIAKATLESITISTMLKQMGRRQSTLAASGVKDTSESAVQ